MTHMMVNYGTRKPPRWQQHLSNMFARLIGPVALLGALGTLLSVLYLLGWAALA